MNSLLDQLNPQQQQAVCHKTGPAVVLAGAGSGKTKVLTTRVAWLIQQQQLSPEQILLVTFTNKAASEMNKRVFDLTGFELPFSGTFHSLCAKILRRHGQYINLKSGFSIFDSDDQLSLIKQIYKDHNFDKKAFKPQKIKAMISQAKNEMLSIEEYQNLANNGDQEFAAKIYKLYNNALSQQQAVDFDDLLLLAVKLLQTDKNILQLYQDQFDQVLVDEYQDTNKAQYQLSKLLARPQDNIYVVGDFSQSIYAWRGADYRNLFFLENDFNGLAEYRLEQNYRSTQTILDAASQVISKNTSHPVLKLWTQKPLSDKIVILETDNEEDEAMLIAQTIRQKLPLFKLREVAILYRTNAQSRPFEEMFIHYQLPYRIVGGFKFYERKEVKDVLAYLRLLANPLDKVSYARVLKIGKRRYDKLQIWQEQQQQSDYYQQPPFDLLNQILQTTDYLAKYDEDNPEEQSKIENINELINVATKFKTTGQFLENVALIQDDYLKDYPYQEEPDRITLMSLHSAKGLEFPVVFIVGMEEGLLPHSRAIWDPQQLEEERRLCYVGITRAKQKLFFSYARQRYQYGQSKQNVPSRFLADISADLLENNNQPIIHHHYSQKNNEKPNWQKKWADTSKQNSIKPKRRLVVDEDSIEALMKDEIDIDDFINS